MELNHEHAVSFLTGALTLWGVLRAVAKGTATTKDDELVAAGERMKAWTADKARVIWPLVELAAKSNSLPGSVSKAILALEYLRKAYKEAHGSELPKQCEKVANEIWRQISQTAKQL